MRAMFTQKAIFIGNLGAHLLANTIVILGAFLFTYPFFKNKSLLLRSQGEAFGVCVPVFYFIITYDIIMHVMPALKNFVHL